MSIPTLLVTLNVQHLLYSQFLTSLLIISSFTSIWYLCDNIWTIPESHLLQDVSKLKIHSVIVKYYYYILYIIINSGFNNFNFKNASSVTKSFAKVVNLQKNHWKPWN